jgi:type I restriction enzyme S subunit
MPAGTVLFSSRAPIGYVAIASNPITTNQGFKSFVLPTELLSDYIYYYLQRARELAVALSSGTTFREISGANAGLISLPVAPLFEQRRIVAEIEKQFTRLEAGVAALKRVQANLKRYRAAVLKAAVEGRLVPTEAELARREGRSYEPASELLTHILAERKLAQARVPVPPVPRPQARMPVPLVTQPLLAVNPVAQPLLAVNPQARVPLRLKAKYKEPVAPGATNLPALPEGWTWTTSDAVFTFVTSGSRGWAKYYEETGAAFLRVGNLDHETIKLDLREVQHVRPPEGAEGTRTRVAPGDILISITADVGMIGLVPDGIGETYINQHVALARPVDTCNKGYLAWYLASRDGGQRQFLLMQRGATKKGLGLDDIRGARIPLPPVREQGRIVAEIDRRLSVIHELEIQVRANLRRAERLRQAILKRAFEGKLVPQDPNDEPASVLLERIKAAKATGKSGCATSSTATLGCAGQEINMKASGTATLGCVGKRSI